MLTIRRESNDQKKDGAGATAETSFPKVLLVFGFPRSGTTWFANLLNTNPDVIYRHEFLGRSTNNLDAEAVRALKEHKQITDDQYAEMIGAIVKSTPTRTVRRSSRKTIVLFRLARENLFGRQPQR